MLLDAKYLIDQAKFILTSDKLSQLLLTTDEPTPTPSRPSSMRKDTFEFAKEKYFNGYSDNRLVQEIFNLMASSSLNKMRLCPSVLHAVL